MRAWSIRVCQPATPSELPATSRHAQSGNACPAAGTLPSQTAMAGTSSNIQPPSCPAEANVGPPAPACRRKAVCTLPFPFTYKGGSAPYHPHTSPGAPTHQSSTQLHCPASHPHGSTSRLQPPAPPQHHHSALPVGFPSSSIPCTYLLIAPGVQMRRTNEVYKRVAHMSRVCGAPWRSSRSARGWCTRSGGPPCSQSPAPAASQCETADRHALASVSTAEGEHPYFPRAASCCEQRPPCKLPAALCRSGGPR